MPAIKVEQSSPVYLCACRYSSARMLRVTLPVSCRHAQYFYPDDIDDFILPGYY